MGKRIVKTEHWLVGIAVWLLVAGMLLLIRPGGGTRDPSGRLQGSSFYTSPSGTKALYLVFKQLGVPVARLERRMSLAPSQTGLLIVAAIRESLGDDEKDWLENWVSEGGVVLWIPQLTDSTPVADDVSELFGWHVEAGSSEQLAEISATLEPLGRTKSYTLEIRQDWHLAAETDLPYAALAGSDAEPQAIAQPRGEGWFVALADPGMLYNERLGQATHAPFMVHLAALTAGDGLVVFDEYHHGFAGGVSFWSMTFATPARWAIIQSVLLLLLVAFTCGKRLGPPIETRRQRRRRPAEFIEAFANYCRKRNARQLAFTILRERFEHQALGYPGKSAADAGDYEPNNLGETNLLDYAPQPPAGAKALVKAAAALERRRRAIRRKQSCRTSR